ncbi:MAG: ABC transporter substrate-binding protein, partial [Desulfobacteraceae bacterium]
VKAGNELRDHCGGPLGVFLNRPSCLYFLGRYLQPRGLCLSDFRVVEINPRDMAAQFAVGRLPAIVSYDPWALQAMEEGGGVCLATSADFPGCIPECLWAYEGLLKTVPPEDVIKMIQGWIRAVKWIGDPVNRAEFMEILSRRTFRKLGPFSEEDLSRLMEGVRIHSPEEMWERNRDQGGLREYLLSLREFLRENCLLNRPYEVPDIFDNRFVMEALASERKEQNTD